MKLVKWWKNIPKKFNKKELYIQKLLWLTLWIRVNLLSKNKDVKELKMACGLANHSYRKMKKFERLNK